MSDEKVSLEFLGEQMLRMQAELRGVRSEQIQLESEQSSTRADLAAMRSDMTRMRSDVTRVESKVDDLDASVDAKIEQLNTNMTNFAASVSAQFAQVHQTNATNLDLMLKAFEASKR